MNQLCNYRTAYLRLCFHIYIVYSMQKVTFLLTQLKITIFPFLILFKRIESIDMTLCVISFLVSNNNLQYYMPHTLASKSSCPAIHIWSCTVWGIFRPAYLVHRAHVRRIKKNGIRFTCVHFLGDLVSKIH